MSKVKRYEDRKKCGDLILDPLKEKDGLCEKKKSFRNGDEILGVQITDDAGNSVGYPVDLIVSY